MSKLYDMKQHNFAAKQPFKVEFISKDNIAYSTYHVQGFSQVLNTFTCWVTLLDMEKMFELFIDKGLSKYSIFYTDHKGDTMTQIKITVEGK